MSPPFDPLEFLTLAQHLGNRNEESWLRTAVGRAYYSAFLIARDKTGVTGRRRIHTRVIRAVKQRRGYRATGEQLDQLFRLRTVADYELTPLEPDDRNWRHNCSTAETLANNILPRMQAWR